MKQVFPAGAIVFVVAGIYFQIQILDEFLLEHIKSPTLSYWITYLVGIVGLGMLSYAAYKIYDPPKYKWRILYLFSGVALGHLGSELVISIYVACCHEARDGAAIGIGIILMLFWIVGCVICFRWGRAKDLNLVGKDSTF